MYLIGLALPQPTTNANGQSQVDCGNLWKRFQTEGYRDRIPQKLDDDVLAVYYDYHGTHEHPFSYFIGCCVPQGTPAPEGMDRLTIPGGRYQKVVAQGAIPACVGEAWISIWSQDIPRGYFVDFEVYGERAGQQEKAEVDIYLSLRTEVPRKASS